MRGKHLIFHGLFKTGFGHFTLMNDIGIIAITLLIKTKHFKQNFSFIFKVTKRLTKSCNQYSSTLT